MKSCLVASTVDFDSSFNIGSKVLAKRLVGQGVNTTYVSAVAHPLQKRFYKPLTQISGDVLCLQIRSIFPASFLRAREIGRKVLNEYRSAKQIKVDCAIVDTPAHLALFDNVDAERKIFRIADSIAGMYSRFAEKRLFDTLMNSNVELITSSRLIAELLGKKFGKPIEYLPNGYSWNGVGEVCSAQKGIVVYIGHSKFLDYSLIDRVTKKLSDFKFLFYGDKGLLQACSNPNCRFMGFCEPKNVRKVISKASVCIMPFSRETNRLVVDCVNPIKLYEYLACGRPVVSTSWSELKLLNPPIGISNCPDEFAEMILMEDRDQGPYAYEELIDWVRPFNWSQLVDFVLK